ncbi:MAG: hypothetical protein CL678_10660 [Bdellovibrionaceae bacterium]|nr:hypothetical protein [Pseudobdellovibrionaceae bacterium]
MNLSHSISISEKRVLVGRAWNWFNSRKAQTSAKCLSILLAIAITADVATWWFNSASPPQTLGAAADGVFWGLLISIGLLLGSTRVGSRITS